jgi:hypothetical protein
MCKKLFFASTSRCIPLFNFFLLLIFSYSPLALAAPSGTGSENSLSFPPGCEVIGGDYSEPGVGKCVVDGLTGESRCFVAKINCCGNGRLEGDLFDAYNPSTIIHSAEGCDSSGPDCREDCTKCGDSTVQSNHAEQCDKGPANGSAGSNCKADCKTPVCGNGLIDVENTDPVEECDGLDFRPEDEQKNQKVCGPAHAPERRCKLYYCGDGITNDTEQCDGETYRLEYQGQPGKTCDSQCRVHYCGDGVIDPSEECDEGASNGTEGAQCSKQCKADACVWLAASGSWSIYRNTDYQNVNDNMWDVELASRDKIDRYEEVPGCFADYWSSRCPINWMDQNSIDQFMAGARAWANSDSIYALPEGVNTRGVSIYGWCIEYSNTTGARLFNLGQFLGANHVPQSSIDYGTYYYMDKNCKYVPEDQLSGRDVCGFAGMATTPLSLILDEQQFKKSQASLVRFNLALDSSDKFSTWKASAAAPLLVFDPEHTGRVDSAAQLFGNWTFGGRQTLLQSISTTQEVNRRTPWNNGYEALSVLDQNQDGEISGAELHQLSLWFDNDQDAAADPGELKRIEEVGITKLFYQGAAPQQQGQDLYLVIGYERKLNGKIIRGSSVDWYGETFSNLKEAVDALSLPSRKDGHQDSLKPKAGNDSNPLEFTPGVVSKENLNQDISGFWIWTLEGDRLGKKPGVLAIKQHADGSLTGYTVGEARLAKNAVNLKSMVSIQPVNGKVTNTADGLKIEFETLLNPKTGEKSKSHAILKAKGRILDGETSQAVADNGQGKNQAVKFSYRWAAGRSFK